MVESYKTVLCDELTCSYCKISNKASFYIHKNLYKNEKTEKFLWHSHKCTLIMIDESKLSTKLSARKISSIPKSPSTAKLFLSKLPFSLPKRTFSRRSKKFSEGWNYEVYTTLSPCNYHRVMLEQVKWLPKKSNQNETFLYVSLDVESTPIFYKEVMKQTPVIYYEPCYNQDFDQTVNSSLNDSMIHDPKQEGAIAKLTYTTEKLMHLESCINNYSIKLVSMKLSYQPVVIWDVYEDKKGFSTSHIQLTESCESKLLKITTRTSKNFFSDFLFSFSKNRFLEASYSKNEVVKENTYDGIPDDMVVVDIIGEKIQNTSDKLVDNSKEINIDTNKRRAFFRKEPKSDLAQHSENAIKLSVEEKCLCVTNQFTDLVKRGISNKDFSTINSLPPMYERSNNDCRVYYTTDSTIQTKGLLVTDEKNNQNIITNNDTIGNNVVINDNITNDLTNDINYDLIYNLSTNDFILNDVINDLLNYVIIDVINGIISDIIITNNLLANDIVSNEIFNNNIIPNDITNSCNTSKKIPPNVKNKSSKAKTTEFIVSQNKRGPCNGMEAEVIASLDNCKELFSGNSQFNWRENKQVNYNEIRYHYNDSSDIVKSRIYTPRAIQMHLENEVKSIERERQKVSNLSDKPSITLERKRGAKKTIVLASVVPDNNNKKVDSPSSGRIAIPTAFEERYQTKNNK
ncbi:uncharacterized protein LOC105844728 [Hydra vulgaris]|uniref:Uncharacterized protein LOC105844728 n=1 Tax=Hydra vulgaris TaxID=6087 RepID=A0ABM4B607_HYDVU